jgi:hypothetical protein
MQVNREVSPPQSKEVEDTSLPPPLGNSQVVQDTLAVSVPAKFQDLPKHIYSEIISYLPKEDLPAVAQLSKDWQEIANNYYRQQIKYYGTILCDTPLWRFLPHIAEIVKQPSILGYLEHLVNYPSDDPITQWPALWQAAIQCQIPYQLSGLKGVNIDSVKKQANSVINQVKRYSGTTVPTSSTSYLELPQASDAKKLNVWWVYRKLEAIFATIMLYKELDYAHNPNPKGKNIISILLEPRLNRWLNGADLIILDQAFPGILAKVIQRALEPTESASEKERIQELLNRLTEQDLLDYFSQDSNRLKERRDIFLKAIQADYLPLLQKFTNEVLITMVFSEPSSFISSHSFLQLSIQHLIKYFLGILNKEQFEEVLKQKPEISHNLTFEQAKDLLNARYSIDKIRILLLQVDFLHRLTPEQVVELAHKLVPKDFEKVIKSPIFFEYVTRLDQRQIKSNQCLGSQKKPSQNDNVSFHPPIDYPVSQFIMNLATNPKEDKTLKISMPLHTAPNIVAQRSTFISLLTIDELFELNKMDGTNISVPLALVQDDAVIYRLKEVGRLVEMIIKHTIVGQDFAERRLYLLSAEELRLFVKRYQCYSEFNWLACQEIRDVQWLILAALVSRLTPIIKENYSTQLAQAAIRHLKRLKDETASALPIETLREWRCRRPFRVYFSRCKRCSIRYLHACRRR